MSLSLPNSAQVTALGRHVVSYAMGGVTALAAMNLISAGDATTVANSITQISSGAAQIAAGLAPLITLMSGLWAAYTASHGQQVAAVAAAVQSGALPPMSIPPK